MCLFLFLNFFSFLNLKIHNFFFYFLIFQYKKHYLKTFFPKKFFKILTLIKCAKILATGTVMLPLAFCALSVGILFGCYTLAAAKNPEESESIYNSAMTAFALIETFTFLGIVICVVINIVL